MDIAPLLLSFEVILYSFFMKYAVVTHHLNCFKGCISLVVMWNICMEGKYKPPC
jgi:hypothetical protein